MTSYRQIEVNRRNALRSTGPRRNAVRHGLMAETHYRTITRFRPRPGRCTNPLHVGPSQMRVAHVEYPCLTDFHPLQIAAHTRIGRSNLTFVGPGVIRSHCSIRSNPRLVAADGLELARSALAFEQRVSCFSPPQVQDKAPQGCR